MAVRINKNRSRITEPRSIETEQGPNTIRYLHDLVKTIRTRFESAENELDEIRTESFSFTSSSLTVDVSQAAFIYLLDTSGGVVTVNLPPAEQTENKTYYIKKTTNDANTVDITPNGFDTIDGGALYQISGGSLGSVVIYSDGSQWWVLSSV